MHKIQNLIHQGLSNNLRALQSNSVLLGQNEQLWKIMNGLFEVAKKVLDAAADKNLDEIDFAKLLILTNSLSDLVAVTHMLQIGFFRPAGTVLRALVENVSLAVAINQKPEIYDQYRKGKYDIPRAVTVARNFIDEIGKVNGLLSNMFTHEPHESIGRGIRVSNNSTEIMLVPGIDQEDGRTFSVLANAAAMTAVMLGESLEWCLARHLNSFEFWERVDDQNIKTKPNELKTFALSMADDLEKLLKSK